ncbi:MAG TPA: GNAT family protein [Gemmatimonadales bacterium]|jgi:RimJ/RimL family protein N-acetyltransferase|nr:GNAT family protein [Gemmatimonadales bacterium]
MNPTPLVLAGSVVRLEPLTERHAPDLLAAADDPNIWMYLPAYQPKSLADMQAWIRAALASAASGEQIPFAIVALANDRAVGSTRFLEIRREDRALEIGWTWLATPVQRSAVNTECKLLLLRHAFEALGALRVQFKTDRRNLRSQRALERLGAVKEGILRKQRINHDGFVRDAVYYSIVDDEWPDVKARLQQRLAQAELSGGR